MDEVSSSVDRVTDGLMQEVIRKEFEGRTVIAIAHGLETILDFDRVVVMDKGRVVEVRAPSELMGRREGGWFRGLVDGRERQWRRMSTVRDEGLEGG